MSNNLGRTPVASAQGSNVFVAINDADEVMDKALSGAITVLVDSTNLVTLTEADWLNQTIRFIDDSPSADGLVTVTVPDVVRGLVTIINDLPQPLEVEISGQPLAGPTIGPGLTGVVSSDGINVRSAGGGGAVYDIPVSFPGTPTSNEILGAFMLPRDVTLPADFSTSVGYVRVAPAAPFIISVRDDNVEIGTITIGGGSPSTGFVFETVDNVAKIIEAGSLLEFVAPNTPDGSIEYIIATLAGLA